MFFRAGWVYFGKEPSRTEVINYIDGELINLFKTLKYHAEEVQRLLQYEICSRDIFNEYISSDISVLTDVQRSVRFIYTLSQSFASKGEHFGYGTKGIPKPQIFNTGHLQDVKNRLRNTYVENLNFEEIFKKYDGEETFFFCDPPYLETTGYKNKFRKEDHIKLSDILKNIQGKFLLTINDHPVIRDLYREFNVIETELGCSVSKNSNGRKKYKELIIMNY